eukprot:TRINITY_DN6376_c0_g2_i1.p1 TRINITY_DN6376_c0_g2~~TRINITY_DN6376_c0_g2_i1.p1  ORF type:complete len:544 (-),score=159.96 TRINITY_DN6376_c0_g2_i1:68-1699(-)
MKLVECVPNFSEGKDQKVINAIVDGVRAVAGCTVLDVDAGASTNRTVLTFVGSPEAVVSGAFECAKKCFELIDMTKHKGEHPRMGAMDVCPFVPVCGVTMEECVQCAHAFARRASTELGIPLFLYEEASKRSYRKALKDIRAGEYEGLAKKLQNPDWAPDYGTPQFLPKYGATVTGARFFLVAYNINVLGTKEQAHRIALNLRETGRGPDKPGRLPKTKAIGWWVQEYNMAQVSMNLDDYRVSAPHVAYEEAKKDAAEIGVAVVGSEIVGLVPLDCLMKAADYYAKKENLLLLEEDQKIRLVVERLGLGSCKPFEANKRVVEYIVRGDAAKTQPLASLPVRQFVTAVGARTPAPGGGSVAALIGALGAALGTMMGLLSYGRIKFADKDGVMRENIPTIHKAMTDLIPLIDADTEAYNGLYAANIMPNDTQEQKRAKAEAVAKATRKAIEIPMMTMRVSSSCWPAMMQMALHGNIGSKSDLEVGAKALELAVWGAHRNVLINMKDVPKTDTWAVETLQEAQKLADLAASEATKVVTAINARPDA